MGLAALQTPENSHAWPRLPIKAIHYEIVGAWLQYTLETACFLRCCPNIPSRIFTYMHLVMQSTMASAL